MTTEFVACVGQRDLPQYMRGALETAGQYYVEQGCIVISGNATGADQAYALGASIADPQKVWLYLPWEGYERKAVVYGNKVIYSRDASPETEELAATSCLKDWHNLPNPKKLLFIRNAMIATRCTFLIAHPNKSKRGWAGTGHAMRCAQMLGKKVWLATDSRWWTISEGMRLES